MPRRQRLRQAGLAFGALVLVLGMSAPASSDDNPGISTVIRMTMVGGTLVAVPIRLNGLGPFLMLLDTGGRSTMVSPQLAAQLGLVPRVRYAIDTIAGSTTALAGEVESLALGTCVWQRPEVLWMPLDAVQAMDPRLEGVIGLDLLSQVDFLLDYPRMALVLLPASEASRRLTGTKTRLHRMNGRFGVSASAGRSRSGPTVALVLDSGVDHLVLFDSEAARPLRANGRPLDGQAEVTSHAGTRLVRLMRLPSLRIDDVSINDVLVLDVEKPAGDRAEGGLLPTRLFDRVYFAPTGGFIILDPRLLPDGGQSARMTRRD